MRQIGQDVATDPNTPKVTEYIKDADFSIVANKIAYAQFCRNQFAAMSHRFCTSRLNMSSGKFGEAE